MTSVDTSIEIGGAIRELRKRRRMNGETLARLAGMSQSKISKIETGAAGNLKPAEIEVILTALQASQTIRQRVSIILEDNGIPQLRSRSIHRYDFEKTYRNERKAKAVRVFSGGVIPALLQTIQYRRALLRPLVGRKELETALRPGVGCQDTLFDEGRQFHFLFPEAVLYTRVATKVVHRQQFDRLDRLLDLENVKIGILPFQAGLTANDSSTFFLYDENFLGRAVNDREIHTSDASSIARYGKIFATLTRRADYGYEARAMIHQAQEFFS